jgi:ABC-type sugar transport system substrate-binding protein
MQAHALARALDGRGGVLVIEGDPYNDNARNIAQGNRDTLACYPAITMLENQPSPVWSRETAQAIVREALANHGADRIRGIIAANDDMAVGVADVLAEQDLTGQVQLVGGDGDAAALDLIRRGGMVGTAFQDPAVLASSALDDVLRVCEGSLTTADFPRASIFYAPAGPRVAVRDIPYIWIDRTNLAPLETYWASRVQPSLARSAIMRA